MDINSIKKTILITGASGFIGISLVKKFKKNYNIIGIDIINSSQVYCDFFYNIDISNNEKIKTIFELHSIDYIIHSAAEKSLFECEIQKIHAHKINYEASKNLYEISLKKNIKFIFISSDQVFNGKKGNYKENDTPNPINFYGVLKTKFENLIKNDGKSSICRTALVFGEIPVSQQNNFNEIKNSNKLIVQGYFVQHVANRLKENKVIFLSKDEYINPTYTDLLYKQIESILINNLNGIFHCCGGEKISRFEFGKKIAQILELDGNYIKHFKSDNKLRPKDVSLDYKYSQRKLNLEYEDIEKSLIHLKNIENRVS